MLRAKFDLNFLRVIMFYHHFFFTQRVSTDSYINFHLAVCQIILISIGSMLETPWSGVEDGLHLIDSSYGLQRGTWDTQEHKLDDQIDLSLNSALMLISFAHGFLI